MICYIDVRFCWVEYCWRPIRHWIGRFSGCTTSILWQRMG
jgi:hypothetical protein